MESIAAQAVEALTADWLVRIIETMLKDYGAKDVRVVGSVMTTEMTIIIHTKRHAVWRPRVSSRQPVWNQEEPWQQYKERTAHAVVVDIAQWMANEGLL